MKTIQEFIRQIGTGEAVRSLIPMGFGMSYPLLRTEGEHLLVTVFYYRSKVKPQDKTELFPPEYVLTFDFPSGRLMTFETLRVDPRCRNIAFDKPAGLFRHEAIRDLNRDQYRAKREEFYESLNGLIAYLGGEGSFSAEQEQTLSELCTLLYEPPLYPFYRTLARPFFERFVKA